MVSSAQPPVRQQVQTYRQEQPQGYPKAPLQQQVMMPPVVSLADHLEHPRPSPAKAKAAAVIEKFHSLQQQQMQYQQLYAVPEPETKPFSPLNDEILWRLNSDSDPSENLEGAAERVKTTISFILTQVDPNGHVEIFGSYTNGLKTGGSDIDVAYLGDIGPDGAISMLEKLVAALPDFGFHNIVKIFQARIPLLKFTDIESGIEVDFCLGNKLGVRNSKLLAAYGRFDGRVHQLGTLVKMWAKRHELVGTPDGCLNSYAWALLTIHYLQSVNDPVVPNLQKLAKESFPISDSKWCSGDCWETKFVADVASLPPSKNHQSIAELLVGFFRFYGHLFDWNTHAVCPRLNEAGSAVDKFSLVVAITDEQWYIEDPFDLRHNLGGQCTEGGRKRIIAEMQRTFQVLHSGGHWCQVCPPGAPALCYLKTRVGRGCTAEALVGAFLEFDIEKVHFPTSDSSMNAFLVFRTTAARRRAHTKNEAYVGDTQLLLFYSSQFSLVEALEQGSYCTYGPLSHDAADSNVGGTVPCWMSRTAIQDITGLRS
eukprot:gnl/TRDRNA2_/TRDRNA2_173552_c5_seq6.p1 gnl/TRDRNA2_/TRDRNA2_173552_c5~~gnl/TRDRNA2_/TRDRNA2_173552_c5_seq6.p1  ORF type:complete len:539 (+),score=73.94 gnl/TRDRNA2_/TRDRNA2_173552_c5_seq6:85-1701(+)